MPPDLTTRQRLALSLGRLASQASRMSGRGDGEVIEGRVGLTLAPDLLPYLAADRPIALVTGTNGKSTVTSLLAAAAASVGTVAWNAGGSNMHDGLATALNRQRTADRAVLEVDEIFLGPSVDAVSPQVLVVLNVSREYTRGISLPRTLQHWREIAARLGPETTVVANVDDPLVQWAFEDAPAFVGVSGGLWWTRDARFCPACDAPVNGLGGAWSCSGCRRRRREPSWSATATPTSSVGRTAVTVSGPGVEVQTTTHVLGRPAAAAPAFAIAAANVLGVAPTRAAAAIDTVDDSGGRYHPFHVGGRTARLLMLKNPAGWAEAIAVVDRSDAACVMVYDPFGPRDITPLWEASWDLLAGRSITVTGGRADEAAACLEAFGVAVVVEPDALRAIAAQPSGPVLVLCNYSAYRRMVPLLRAEAALP